MVKSISKVTMLFCAGLFFVSSLSAQSIEEYNLNHPGFELSFSATVLPLSGSENLGGWVGLNSDQSDHGLGFSLGGVFYQRSAEKEDAFYDIGIMLGYTKMGEVNSSGLAAFEVGVSLRNPLWGVKNPAFFQSLTLMAISPAYTENGNGNTNVGAGFGVKARLGYQKPVSELQAFTFFLEGQFTQDITTANANFYTVGAGAQINLLFQN